MASTPSHPLDAREKLYVTHQCFIPHAIWPKIEQGFMQARTNQFEESNALAFLDFALGFTALKKQPVLTSDPETIKRAVFTKIQTFFADYDMQEDSVTAYVVQANVELFMDAIFGHSTKRPRPLFLVGDGGIGKTKFAHVVYEVICESLGDKIQFCNEVIAQPDDLEGSATKPGLFLKVAQQMHTGGLYGSVLMLDEATWLNDDDHVSPAKRTFNGDLTNQKTLYFGSGPLGQGVDFDLPPMLVVVASNSDIEDKALASRFDKVQFPNPKKQSLAHYASTLVGGAPNATEVKAFDGVTSFRKVQELSAVLLAQRKYKTAAVA